MPQRGERFELVDRRVSWGEMRLYYYDGEGRVQYIPEAWTDLATVDPRVEIGGGDACFRADDLLRLAALVRALRGEDSEG